MSDSEKQQESVVIQFPLFGKIVVLLKGSDDFKFWANIHRDIG